MITIEEAVRFELDKFMNENAMLMEKRKGRRKKKDKKSEDDNKGGKNAIKTKGGGRKSIDYKSERKSNPNISNADQGDLSRILKSKAVNVSAIAQELYPDHTKEGAQSQLRKKFKGLESDSGSVYRIKRKEARRLRRILARLFDI